MRRQVALEGLHRALGLPLLQEGERRVQEDDADDRRRQHGRARNKGQQGGDPEEERERMRQLAGHLAGPPPAGWTSELVRALGEEPPLGLAAREAAGGRSEMPQQQVGRLVQLEGGLSGAERRTAVRLLSHRAQIVSTRPIPSIGSTADHGCVQLPNP